MCEALAARSKVNGEIGTRTCHAFATKRANDLCPSLVREHTTCTRQRAHLKSKSESATKLLITHRAQNKELTRSSMDVATVILCKEHSSSQSVVRPN